MSLLEPERAAGESQLTPETPASPPPSPLSLGDSESAPPAASQPTNEAWTNITAGVGGEPTAAPEKSKWISAPGRREHKALAFLRRSWGYYGITERGYWVRMSPKRRAR